MVESNFNLNAARVIRETRQTKHYFPISDAEMDYVLHSPILSDGEKIIWLKIAQKSALGNNFSCLLTQSQIADMVDKKPDTVYRAIKILVAQGFLQKHYERGDKATQYYLTLPSTGVEALLAAPTRANFIHNPEKNPGAIGKISGIHPEKNPTLLINNNINNKNINHNLDLPKAPHDPEPESKPSEPRHNTVSNADALICEYKNLQEKFKYLPISKQVQALKAHFSSDDWLKIYTRQRELAAIEATKTLATKPTPAFVEKLEQAKPVPVARTNQPNVKLVEFDFEGEHFLVEEQVKNQILNQIPNLYQQNKISGEARNKSLKTLMAEIFYYVAKAASKALDACQLKRFYIARKLCLNGSWERPKGLERQASVQREQKWQQEKLKENKVAKVFTDNFIKSVA